MARALFITGTGTDVGKTALSLAVLLWARSRGLSAAYCKPIQCGDFLFGDPPTPHGDADWIKAMLPEAATHVVYRFRSPVSPHLAAEREGVAVFSEQLRAELEVLSRQGDLLVVEGAGGPAVPYDRRGSSLGALAGEMGWPCLMACAPGLGTLHHSLATLAWLERQAVETAGFAFCHREAEAPGMAEDNLRTLRELSGLPCFGSLPFLPALSRPGPLAPAEAARLSVPLTPSLDAWWSTTRS